MSDTFDHELDAYEDAEMRENYDRDFPLEDTKAAIKKGGFTGRLRRFKSQGHTKDGNGVTCCSKIYFPSMGDKKVVVDHLDCWTYYRRNECSLTAEEWQMERKRGDVTGKYLFFCKHLDWLEELVKDELECNGFMVGKISTTPSGTGDYVLCLYWVDDSRKWELGRKYPNADDNPLKYRFWKSDADTVAGKYSKEYFKGLAQELTHEDYGDRDDG